MEIHRGAACELSPYTCDCVNPLWTRFANAAWRLTLRCRGEGLLTFAHSLHFAKVICQYGTYRFNNEGPFS